MQPTTFFKEAQAAGAIPQTARLQSSYQFGDEADQLAQLIIAGKKTATTSLYELYEKDGDELPTKQAYDVILDGRQQPVAIIKNDDVQVVDYLAVDATHAFAEGEGDRTLQAWRTAHDRFFAEECQAEGLQFDPATARAVLETFHVVYVR
ncbi:hypothetical protein B808_875 [Fructilactobacillus florum 8D]|uniref:ASCH domain-containing protein n=1 Tax=Fructilactobacillus florum 8D TaxID=1221538 RepID=W9EDN1_9LACO|nr:ASCH domain-containing protein [Fructilactobacillus florum]ETO40233.1 hypothetical protein B808_875 [Fructilactobacillus florum 8D]